MGFIDLSQIELMSFFIVLVRIGAMTIWFPLFGHASIPPIVKICFIFVLSLVVYPVARGYINITIPTAAVPLTLLVFEEISIGFMIGIVSRMTFYAVAFGAQMISYLMGLGIVGIFDPNTQQRASILNQFQFVLAILLFLIVNGHYFFFEGIISSYQYVAPGSFTISSQFADEIINITSAAIVVGFKLSAPIVAVLLITNAGLGVVSRSVPQMNVFMISFPITISLGLIMIALSIPLFMNVLTAEFEQIGSNIIRLLKTI